jgi:hypothetical protein
MSYPYLNSDAPEIADLFERGEIPAPGLTVIATCAGCGDRVEGFPSGEWSTCSCPADPAATLSEF